MQRLRSTGNTYKAIANTCSPDSVGQNYQLDGTVGSGTTRGAMDDIDAIEGSNIHGGGLQIGAGAFGENQQASSDG